VADVVDFQSRDFPGPRHVFSVLLVGVPFHLLRVWIAKRFFRSVQVPVAPTKIRQLNTLSTALMMAQVVVTFFVTKWAYYWYFS
jgi:hypothetical protein